jgi:hypothetical protein
MLLLCAVLRRTELRGRNRRRREGYAQAQQGRRSGNSCSLAPVLNLDVLLSNRCGCFNAAFQSASSIFS